MPQLSGNGGFLCAFCRLRTTLVIFALFAFLGIAAAWALFAWLSLDDVQMGGHGYAAMILGIVFSLGLGFGSYGPYVL